MLHSLHTSGARLVASRLCLVTETAHYVHTVLASVCLVLLQATIEEFLHFMFSA